MTQGPEDTTPYGAQPWSNPPPAEPEQPFDEARPRYTQPPVQPPVQQYGVPPVAYGGSPMAPWGAHPRIGPGHSPTAPFGVHPVLGIPYSEKSKVTAGLLQLLPSMIGLCGIGRLYTGHVAIGLLQLIGMFVGFVLMLVLIGFLIVPAVWLWAMIDGVQILATNSKDADGRLLRG